MSCNGQAQPDKRRTMPAFPMVLHGYPQPVHESPHGLPSLLNDFTLYGDLYRFNGKVNPFHVRYQYGQQFQRI
jgi:hypothetical protein